MNHLKLVLVLSLFTVGLLFPAVMLVSHLLADYGFSVDRWQTLLQDMELLTSLNHSIFISAVVALLAVILASLCSYTLHFSPVSQQIKKMVRFFILLPMLLPTITYGFAVIYLFGQNGVVNRSLEIAFIDVYGVGGVIIAFLLYVIGPTFLIIDNAFRNLDPNISHVSDVFGDNKFRRLINSVFPVIRYGLMTGFFVAFTLSFTDYGIPMVLGYDTTASYLYKVTLGSFPDLSKGAFVAIALCLPSLLSFFMLNKFNKKIEFDHELTEMFPPRPNKIREWLLWTITSAWLLVVLAVFAIIIIFPFIKSYPYNLTFSFDAFERAFTRYDILHTVAITLLIACLTAMIGAAMSFSAAYLTTRAGRCGGKSIHPTLVWWIEHLAVIPNMIPGMTLGLAYVFSFSGTPLYNTVLILVMVNVIHYFTSPYLMYKERLLKLNNNLESAGTVLGDSHLNVIFRVILPNTKKTTCEVMSYLLIHSLTTISALVFLASPTLGTLALKVKELEHFSDFSAIFVISLLILLINLIVKISSNYITQKKAING